MSSLYDNTVGTVLTGVNGFVDTVKNSLNGSTSGLFTPPKAPEGGKTDVKKSGENIVKKSVDKVKTAVNDTKAKLTPLVFFGGLAFILYMFGNKK